MDALTAGQELKGLVQQGLFIQHGVGRWTTYTLMAKPEVMPPRGLLGDEEKIVAYVKENGSISNAECRSLLGVDQVRAYYLLRKLRGAGHLKEVGKGRWRRYVPLWLVSGYPESIQHSSG